MVAHHQNIMADRLQEKEEGGSSSSIKGRGVLAFPIVPELLLDDLAAPHSGPGLDESALKEGERLSIGLPSDELDLIHEKSTFRPASKDAVELPIDNLPLAEFYALSIPFGAHAMRNPIPEMLDDLKLAVCVPTLGDSVEQTVGYGGTGAERAVGIVLHHPPVESVGRSNPMEASGAKFQLRARNFHDIDGRILDRRREWRLGGEPDEHAGEDDGKSPE